jgi:metallo-beta-lactamase class B
MRKYVVAALGALGAVSVLPASAPAQSVKDFLDRMIALWNKPTEPFQVAGNVYFVGTYGLASYLVTTPEGHVLIDTGLPEANPQIKANVAKLGFKVADIKYLLNTHAHLDHTGVLAELKQETGAKLVAGERDKPLLEGGYYPGRESAKELGFPPVKVDRAVKDGDTVSLGGVTLTAHATPGHSPGCTSWSLSVKDGDAVRSALVFCSATVALNRLAGAPTHPGIVEDYRKTFAWARTYKTDIFLAPHPEMFDMYEKREKIAAGAPNPFVDPAAFGAYTARLEKAFEEVLVKQTAEAQGSK